MSARIVVVGSINSDLVVRALRIPFPGETVTGGTFFQADGGKGANQAVAAARLGAHVCLVACVGVDELGDHALSGLRDEGIDVSFVRRDPVEATGVALIVVDGNGENAIAVAPGANACLTVEDVEAARPAIHDADIVLVQLETPLEAVERAATLALEAGVSVILNPAPARPLPDALLRLVDVLTPNESEVTALGGEKDVRSAGSAILQRGVETVVVTLGARGAMIMGAHGASSIPAFDINAADTTAAGDAFNGALAVGLARGLDIEGAVLLGCAAGALAATVEGARPSLPTRSQVEHLLNRV